MKAKHEMLNMTQHISQNAAILTSFKIMIFELNLKISFTKCFYTNLI
jgi:hypothetical protein